MHTIFHLFSRLIWIGLNELYPDFVEMVCITYGMVYTNGVLMYKDSSDYTNSQRQSVVKAKVEQQVSKCFIHTLPQSVSHDFLFLSLKKALTLQPKTATVFKHDRYQYLCANSESKMSEVDKMINEPQVQIVHASFDVFKTIREKFTTEVYKIESDNLVEISFDVVKQISVKSYLRNSVHKAKGEILSLVRSLKRTKEQLCCPSPIRAYINHIICERKLSPEQHKLYLSLEVEVITEDNTIFLEGLRTSIATEEEKLISGLVPKTLNYEEFKFSCNQKFIPQIKNNFLRPLRDRYDFIHIVSCPIAAAEPNVAIKNGRRKSSNVSRQRSRNATDGFSIFVYSTNKSDFRELVSSIKVSTCTFSNALLLFSFVIGIRPKYSPVSDTWEILRVRTESKK